MLVHPPGNFDRPSGPRSSATRPTPTEPRSSRRAKPIETLRKGWSRIRDRKEPSGQNGSARLASYLVTAPIPKPVARAIGTASDAHRVRVRGEVDGFRALVSTEDGLRVLSRRRWDMTDRLPELAGLPPGLVLDGEIVGWGEDGPPRFRLLSAGFTAGPGSRSPTSFSTYWRPMVRARWRSRSPSGDGCSRIST